MLKAVKVRLYPTPEQEEGARVPVRGHAVDVHHALEVAPDRMEGTRRARHQADDGRRLVELKAAEEERGG